MSGYRRRNAQALYESHYGPNMTPMVDVVMVILIFFMASTAFLGPEWFLKTYLPTRGSAATADQSKRMQVELKAGLEGAVVTLNGEGGLSIGGLEARLAEELRRTPAADIVVPIEASADVAYEDVVRVHEVCQRLGIGKVGLK
jgi:biopolymer transport protein ExbD